MHHLFMLVVILALLPAAIATALALGQILFYVLIGVAILAAIIFLIANPDILLGLLGAAIVFAGFIVGCYAVMWAAAQAEKKWPCILQRLGYGSGAIFCAGVALVAPFTSSRPGEAASGKIFVFLFFGLIAGALGWWSMKAKPTDTSKWFKS